MAEPTIQDLHDEGFVLVTQWLLAGNRIRLESLAWPETSGWLYAFVVNNETVKYVGLTERILRSRMDNYRDGKADQNLRLQQLVLTTLNRGHSVSIYGRQEPDASRMISEESRLRVEWQPEWNRV